MPPTSKKQAAFMRAVANKSIKAPGLSPTQAEEYVSGYPTRDLPEYAGDKPDAQKMQRKRQMASKKK